MDVNLDFVCNRFEDLSVGAWFVVFSHPNRNFDARNSIWMKVSLDPTEVDTLAMGKMAAVKVAHVYDKDRDKNKSSTPLGSMVTFASDSVVGILNHHSTVVEMEVD